jgi:hypothetical protein
VARRSSTGSETSGEDTNAEALKKRPAAEGGECRRYPQCTVPSFLVLLPIYEEGARCLGGQRRREVHRREVSPPLRYPRVVRERPPKP